MNTAADLLRAEILAAPIPPLRDRPWDGPDMRDAPALEQQLGWLDKLKDDPALYAKGWVRLLGTFGSVGRVIHADGNEDLCPGVAADAQLMHRRAWLDAFCDHLVGTGHRDAVLDLVRAQASAGTGKAA